MPIYEYACLDCGREFEELVRGDETARLPQVRQAAAGTPHERHRRATSPAASRPAPPAMSAAPPIVAARTAGCTDNGRLATPSLRDSIMLSDTHPDAERMQIELLRRMQPQERFRTVSISDGVRRRLVSTNDRQSESALERARSRMCCGWNCTTVKNLAAQTSRVPGQNASKIMLLPEILAAMTPVVAEFETTWRQVLPLAVRSSVRCTAFSRATLDVDLVADLAAAHVAPLVNALQARLLHRRPHDFGCDCSQAPVSTSFILPTSFQG